MKRRIIIITTLLFMAVGTSLGQIIYTQEDQGTHLRQVTPNGFGIMVPVQNVDYDQWKQEFVPLGDGLLLLIGLGTTYFLRRRKNKS